MIALAVLFLVPIYYLAKSKGYGGKGLCVASLAFGFGGPYLLYYLLDVSISPLSPYAVAALILLTLWLLPARKGAPGKAYLKITFTCPECKKIVTFKRQEEGEVTLCPLCKEIITVPEDEFSPKKNQRNTVCPTPVDGRVCFETYANEMKANEVTTYLVGNGIQAFLFSPAGGVAMPQLGLCQGYSVLINAEDWDRAIELEKAFDRKAETVCCQDASTAAQ